VIREATDADLPVVRELFREFMHELEDAPHRDDDTEADLAKIERGLGKGWHVLLAERDDKAIGLAVAEKAGTRVGYLSSLYVRPGVRGSGIAAELVRELVARLKAQGVEVLELDVSSSLLEKLEELGTVTVMPLGSPIGSGQGLQTLEQIRIIVEEASVPVVVDAGIGAPSDAALAMELGADAVLVNSAVALARDPGLMAEAIKEGVEAGRKAYIAGRIPKRGHASASSPTEGISRPN